MPKLILALLGQQARTSWAIAEVVRSLEIRRAAADQELLRRVPAHPYVFDLTHVRVGLTTASPTYLAKEVRLLVEQGCQVIVCAARVRGRTDRFLEDIADSHRYHLMHWTLLEYIPSSQSWASKPNESIAASLAEYQLRSLLDMVAHLQRMV